MRAQGKRKGAHNRPIPTCSENWSGNVSRGHDVEISDVQTAGWTDGDAAGWKPAAAAAAAAASSATELCMPAA